MSRGKRERREKKKKKNMNYIKKKRRKKIKRLGSEGLKIKNAINKKIIKEKGRDKEGT